MAKLRTEGFDWQAAANDIARVGGSYLTGGGSAPLPSIAIVTGAYGVGRAFRFDRNTAQAFGRFALMDFGFASASRLLVSADIALDYVDSTATATGTGFLTLLDSSTPHLDFHSDGTGKITVRRAGTLLGIGTNTVFSGLSNFVHVEIDVTIHDTAGAVLVKVNGVTEINLTNVDTRNGANAQVNVARFSWTSNAATFPSQFALDNLVIQDTTGPAPWNAWLGPVIVNGTLRPAADVSVQGTPSSGSNHAALVDEAQLNTADYVSFTAGQEDRYTIDNLAGNPVTIRSVKVIAVANGTSGGQTGRVKAHVGGNTTTGSTEAVATTGAVALDMDAKPGGGAWTTADVNGLEVAFERVA